MSTDFETIRRLHAVENDEDQAQAEWLRDHPDPPRYEFPLILLAASGCTLVLVTLAYTFAKWWVG